MGVGVRLGYQNLHDRPRLVGKRVLVAGAGGKMGSEFARAFAREGADLVLTTRDGDKLTALAAELQEMQIRTATVAADFTVRADVDRLAERAWNAFGGIDVVLLSSQPAQPSMGDLLSTSDEDWLQQQMAVAWGPFRLLKTLAPKMMAAGGASIITLTSSTAHEPVRGYGAYGLAKSALWTLTRYMAAEWGYGGVRVNSICPGMIATGGTGAPNGAPPSMLERTSLRRVGRSHEVTGAAIYLASDESSFTTGQCIFVNGGRF
jgi:NAD(P)-dependent dehydrogenase (short-subunit alcohol dehydrogenase family)